MTEEDKKYRQGRRKEQYENSAKVAMIAIIGLIVTLILVKLGL